MLDLRGVLDILILSDTSTLEKKEMNSYISVSIHI